VPDRREAGETTFARLLENRLLPWVWLALLVLLALVTWRGWSLHPPVVDSNLLALLPPEDVSTTVKQAQSRLLAAAERRVIVLVGGGDLPAAIRAGDAYQAALAQAPAVFGRITYVIDGTMQAGWRAFYAPYHHALLSARVRAHLRDGDGTFAVRQALHWYYSPIGLPGRLPPTQDPFQLFGQWQLERASGSRLQVLQDRLVAVEGERHYVALMLEIAGSPFEPGTQGQVVAALAEARAAARRAVPGVSVLAAGIVLHAAEATERAEREVWLIGLGSLIGIAVLTLVAFRSLWLLLLAQLPILVGCLAAWALCVLLFDRLHALTLVFGTSLLGVAVDYSFLYLSHTARQDSLAQRFARLRALAPGLWLAWVTTVLGYLALAIPPLPVLRQMAAFSVSGLLFAWLTVLCWLPWLTRGGAHWDAAPLRMLSALRARWPRARADRRTAGVVVVVLVGLGLGLLRVRVDDDIRLLQSSSPTLLAEQQRVLALTGVANPGQFLVVEAGTPEAVLQVEEAVRDGLDRLQREGLIAGYQALSQWVPSAARQREDHALLARHLYSRGRGLETLGQGLGLPVAWVEATRRAHRVAAATTLPLEAWLGSAVSEPFRHQWLGRTAQGYASVILFSGIGGRAGVQALRAAAGQVPGVVWVDRVETISSLLGRYRRQVGGMLALGYLLVFLALVLRYRVTAWRVMAPTVVASLVAVALFGWLGLAVNLFALLALLLVLGMGVDYGIYLQEERGDHAGAWLGVALAALSTLLSFGLLAFSRTPALQTFGVTMLCGIGLAWLLAPSFRST